MSMCAYVCVCVCFPQFGLKKGLKSIPITSQSTGCGCCPGCVSWLCPWPATYSASCASLRWGRHMALSRTGSLTRITIKCMSCTFRATSSSSLSTTMFWLKCTSIMFFLKIYKENAVWSFMWWWSSSSNDHLLNSSQVGKVQKIIKWCHKMIAPSLWSPLSWFVKHHANQL